MNIFRKKYRQLALRFYSVGKEEFERRHAEMMLERSTVGQGTTFYPGSDIINLSNRKDAIVIGDNCHISGLLLVYSYGGLIKMGNHCSFSPNSRIASAQEITIGNRVLIAHNVNIIDNISHPIDAQLRHEDFMISYSKGMTEYDVRAKGIIIEDDVWIGFNSTILKGVRIGRGAIIGAGTTVTKDVKAWTVNVGNPIRCVRELEPQEVNNVTL